MQPQCHATRRPAGPHLLQLHPVRLAELLRHALHLTEPLRCPHQCLHRWPLAENGLQANRAHQTGHQIAKCCLLPSRVAGWHLQQCACVAERHLTGTRLRPHRPHLRSNLPKLPGIARKARSGRGVLNARALLDTQSARETVPASRAVTAGARVTEEAVTVASGTARDEAKLQRRGAR